MVCKEKTQYPRNGYRSDYFVYCGRRIELCSFINPYFGKVVVVTIGGGRLFTGPAFMLMGISIRKWIECGKQVNKSLLPIMRGVLRYVPFQLC